jgi:hypothetical protein
MVKKLFLATGVVIALSSAAWAQTTVPGGRAPGAGGPIGIGPDTSPRVPGISNPSDPRRALSGSRASDPSPLGTTGGVDAGSALGGATDAISGSSALGSGNPMGAGSIGSGSGVTGSGALTGGANAPLPGTSGMRSSGSLGGAAGAGAGAGVGGAGAAGSGGAGTGGGAR